MTNELPRDLSRKLKWGGRIPPRRIATTAMGLIAVIGTIGLAVGCDSGPPPVLDKAGQDIIGGFAANSPVLDAIGSLVVHFDGGGPLGGPGQVPQELCGATLIASESVLTAKHCALIVPFITSFGGRVTFAVGPDSARPKREVNVAAIELAPGDVGGFVGVGHDVSVMHLESPITDLVPVEMAVLSDEQVDQPFAAIGYGVQDNSGANGTRRLGTQTLRSLRGRVFETMFGSFENFLKWFETGAVPATSALAEDGGAGGAGGRPVPPTRDGGEPPPPPSLEDFARQIYDSTVLDEGYEVVTGGAQGDAQPCFGDSGSSLIHRHDGQFVSYGVVSGGLGSRDSVCDLGTVYATFGPGVLEFLQAAREWVDPCGDIDSHGSCDGNRAVRCTDLSEGRRRLVSFDCGTLEMTCNNNGGQVSCDDNVFGPPRPVPPPSVPPNPRMEADKVFMSAGGLAARHTQP